jgi:hypothetical protein
MPNSSDQFAGKYATEAYDMVVLARLFQRSLYGLILLQLGWIGFLFCLLRLPVGPRMLSMPCVHFRPLKFAPWQADVWWVWMAGALLLLAYWLLKIRGFLLRRMVARSMVLFVWAPAVLLLATLLGIIEFLLLFLVFLFRDSWRIGKHKEQERTRRLDEIRKKQPEISEQEAMEQMEAALRKEFPKAEDPLWVAAVTSLSSGDEPRLLGAALGLLRFTFSDSPARIGVAPLGEFAEGEAPSAPWNGDRIFGVSAERLNLEERQGLWPKARFQMLPSHLTVRTPSEARWLRRLMFMDALIWGQYSSADETVWVRLEIAGSSPRRKDAESRLDADRAYRSGLLGRDMELPLKSLTFAAHDHSASVVTLCACLLHVLQYRNIRWDQGWRQKVSQSQLGFSIFYMGDKLSLRRAKYAREVCRFLATEILPCRKPRSTECTALPSAESLLAQVISSWVGSMFSEIRSVLDEEEDLEARPFLIELKRLLAFCTEVDPHRPEHLYRLGFILCLLGDVDEAAARLAHAGELDVRSLRTDTIMAIVLGELAVDRIFLKHGKELRLARAAWAVHMAAVIAIGGEEGKQRVGEGLSKARNPYHADEPLDPAELVVQRLLNSSRQPE